MIAGMGSMSAGVNRRDAQDCAAERTRIVTTVNARRLPDGGIASTKTSRHQSRASHARAQSPLRQLRAT
jgi:hypothetical protein